MSTSDTFTIARGETLALVGESESGKSTIARMLLRLEDPTSGRQVLVDGADVTTVRGEAWRVLRRKVRPTAELFSDPQDDYTRELLAAIAGRRAGVVS